MGQFRRVPEVRFINSYAAYMGYLLMGIRGLSFLLLTWSTVVLLGGFVSMLQKKDFWSVTVITLMQTAGVFDVFMKQKLSNIGYSYFTLLDSDVYFREPPEGSSRARKLVTTIAWIVMTLGQVLVLSIILFPLAVLYNLGLFICTAIALWRLAQRDYSGGDATNLKPALDVLYSLAVAQGVLFCYRTAYSFAGRGAVEKVMENYRMTSMVGSEIVWGYLHETRNGCDKDPSFCKGRDLITYAGSLMASGDPESDSFISGVSVLEEIIIAERRGRRSKAIKHLLLGSGQPSSILHKLLCMLDSKSESTWMRKMAARIVEHIAGGIHLEQYPSGIHRIISLLPTSPRECVSSDAEDRELMELGMRILLELITAKDNCRIMSDTEGFLSRIVVPLRPVLINDGTRHVSQPMAEASLKLIGRLIVLPGDAGIKMQREISSNSDLIYDMESIADFNRVHCNEELRVQAKQMIMDLSKDVVPSKMASESRRISIMVLIGAFFQDNTDSSNKKSAGERLAALSHKSQSDAQKIFKAGDDVVRNLTKMILHAGNNVCRANAAEILAGLCSHCTGEKFVEKLREAIADLIPEVLRRIHNSSALSYVQNSKKEEMDLQRALLALCSTVCDDMEMGSDPDFAHKLHEIAAKFCSEQGFPVKTLALLIKEARELLDLPKEHGSANVAATSSSPTP